MRACGGCIAAGAAGAAAAPPAAPGAGANAAAAPPPAVATAGAEDEEDATTEFAVSTPPAVTLINTCVQTPWKLKPGFINRVLVAVIFEASKCLSKLASAKTPLLNPYYRLHGNTQPFLCNELGPVQAILGDFQAILGNWLGPFSGDFRQF